MGQNLRKTRAWLHVDDSAAASVIAAALDELGVASDSLAHLSPESERERGLHVVVVDSNPRAMTAVARHFELIGGAVPVICCAQLATMNDIAEKVHRGVSAFAPFPPQPADLKGAILYAAAQLPDVQYRFAMQSARQVLGRLTRRQRQIVAGLFMGLTNKQLASECEISERTVEVHRARIIEKVRAENTAGLIRLVSLAGPDALPEFGAGLWASEAALPSRPARVPGMAPNLAGTARHRSFA